MRHNKPGPCKDCVPPKRHSGCHDHCNEYKKWQQENKDEANRIKEAKKTYNDIYNLHVEMAVKRRKASGKKG